MLVYAKNPNGVIRIGEQRVYGRNLPQGPINLSFSAYNLYRDELVYATYRRPYLLHHFPGPFDNVSFTYSELKWLPRKTLRTLCRGMKLPYHYTDAIKKIVDSIKTELRKC